MTTDTKITGVAPGGFMAAPDTSSPKSSGEAHVKLMVHHDHGWLVVTDINEDIYIKIAKGLGTDAEKAVARRLVACWNKFDGFSTEAVESSLPIENLFVRK